MGLAVVELGYQAAVLPGRKRSQGSFQIMKWWHLYIAFEDSLLQENYNEINVYTVGDVLMS